MISAGEILSEQHKSPDRLMENTTTVKACCIRDKLFSSPGTVEPPITSHWNVRRFRR